MISTNGDTVNSFVEKNHWIRFDYTNWKGEKSTRHVIVKGFVFGANQWHPELQWLMNAWDLEKDEIRVFAMKDMKNVMFI